MQKNNFTHCGGVAFPHGGREGFFLNEKSYITTEKELFFLQKIEFFNTRNDELIFLFFGLDNGVHFNLTVFLLQQYFLLAALILCF